MESLENPCQQEKEVVDEYVPAIKEIIRKYFETINLKECLYFSDIDISDPTMEDMASLHRDDFEITNFRITPRKGDGKQFHFYVGKTEIHITGEAADEIKRLIDKD